MFYLTHSMKRLSWNWHLVPQKRSISAHHGVASAFSRQHRRLFLPLHSTNGSTFWLTVSPLLSSLYRPNMEARRWRIDFVWPRGAAMVVWWFFHCCCYEIMSFFRARIFTVSWAVGPRVRVKGVLFFLLFFFSTTTSSIFLPHKPHRI